MAICLVRAIPRRCSSGSRAVLPGRTSGPRSWRRGGGASLVLLDRTSRPRSWCCEAAAIFALLSVTLTGGLFLYPERFPQPAVPSGAKLAVDSHNRLSPMGPSWPWLPSPKLKELRQSGLRSPSPPAPPSSDGRIAKFSIPRVSTAGCPLRGQVGSGLVLRPAVPHGAKPAVAFPSNLSPVLKELRQSGLRSPSPPAPPSSDGRIAKFSIPRVSTAGCPLRGQVGSGLVPRPAVPHGAKPAVAFPSKSG